MSIQSEITRLEDAKAAMIAAIESKETAVPDGTKLDGLAALIMAITVGSNSGENVSVSGTIGGGTFHYMQWEDGELVKKSDIWTSQNTPKIFQVANNSIAVAIVTSSSKSLAVTNPDALFATDATTGVICLEVTEGISFSATYGTGTGGNAPI